MKLHFLRIWILVVTAATLLGATPSAFAAPSGLYLNPSAGTYQKDTSFAVQLRLNAGSNSGVQANMDFDNAKLQVASISNQGSALDSVTTTYDNGGGRISVYSVSGSDSGDRLITTITFRAISPGTAAVNFARTNQTLRYLLLVPVWTDVATTNASYTILGPVTPPATPGTGGTTPGTGGNKPNSGSPANGNISPTNPATPSPITGTPDSSANTTSPDASAPSRTNISSPEFQTTPPNSEPWESEQSVPTSQLLIPWLPIITTVTLGLLVLGIFTAYRRTHLSKSLRRLLASIVSYRVAKSDEPAASSSFSLPILGKIMPKLLAFKAPKLLASGIKQKLLTTGEKWFSNSPK